MNAKEVYKMMLPKKLKERIEEESEKLGISEEEFIVEALSEYLKIDPEYRIEVHLALSEKYLKEAEEFLEKGDCVQTSEKVWGAASQIVKALAAKKGKALRSHRELHGFVSEIRRELKDPEISTLWLSANSMHQNFYENWLPEETVKDGMENVRKFVKRMKELIK